MFSYHVLGGERTATAKDSIEQGEPMQATNAQGKKKNMGHVRGTQPNRMAPVGRVAPSRRHISDSSMADRRMRYEWHKSRRRSMARRAEENRRHDIKVLIMISSGFMCGGLALSVMLRIGENMFSSLVYGMLIGVFASLVFLVMAAAIAKSDEDQAYDFPEDEDDDEACGNDDFSGLADGFRNRRRGMGKSGTVRAGSASVPRRNVPMLLSGSNQRSMRDFVEILSNDAESRQERQPDVIVKCE